MNNTLLTQSISANADGYSAEFSGGVFSVASVTVTVTALPKDTGPADIPATFTLQRKCEDGSWHALTPAFTISAAGAHTEVVPIAGRIWQDATMNLRLAYTLASAVDSGTLDAAFSITGS